MDTFNLTKEHLARSVLQAIDEKRLGFHLPDEVRASMGCRYSYAPAGYPGFNCAVGCALPGEVHTQIIGHSINASSLDDLIMEGVVKMSDEVLNFAHDLQSMHDDIAQDYGLYHNDEHLAETEGIALLRKLCEDVLAAATTQEAA